MLTDYYEGRNAVAWSRNAKIGNLRNFAEAVNASMKAKSAQLKELKDMFRYADRYRGTKPIHDKWKDIKWKGTREKFEA